MQNDFSSSASVIQYTLKLWIVFRIFFTIVLYCAILAVSRLGTDTMSVAIVLLINLMHRTSIPLPLKYLESLPVTSPDITSGSAVHLLHRLSALRSLHIETVPNFSENKMSINRNARHKCPSHLTYSGLKTLYLFGQCSCTRLNPHRSI